MKYADRIKEIGKRIKSERESYKDESGRKMSQEKLADEISRLLPEEKSVGQNSVSNWEKGNTFPPLEKLVCMAQIFHCDVGYLLCDYDVKSKDTATISDETGLSIQAVERLKSMQAKIKREKSIGWNGTFDEQELRAINTLLEHDYSVLLSMYQYLYWDYDTYLVTTADEHGRDRDICTNEILIGHKDNPNMGGVFVPVDDTRETFMLKIQRGLIELYNRIHQKDETLGKRTKNNK